MTILPPRSERAASALELVESLQSRLVARLEAVGRAEGHDVPFARTRWLRDGGQHGGGHRDGTGDTPVFNRASVNVSQVHYDDVPTKRLGSATALSTIVHPQPPRAPSTHVHISYTEMRDGRGVWRVMADLNPSIPDDAQTARFREAVEGALGPLAPEARAQGDRYFFIPALDRHRGVAHYYLESWTSGDFDEDRALARTTGEATIDAYGALLAEAIAAHAGATPSDQRAQLAYHTTYLFQVCTLDRGTTSGLLVHDQNDVGILGSLPARVDRGLLASWARRVPPMQRALVEGLVAALPDTQPSDVTVEAKQRLAQVVRAHYRAHPEALDLQARGDVVPPTVSNHGD